MDIVEIVVGILTLLLVGIAIILILGVIWAIVGAIVAFLWNLVIPGLFGLPTIDFIQGMILYILGNFLVGGIKIKSTSECKC